MRFPYLGGLAVALLMGGCGDVDGCPRIDPPAATAAQIMLLDPTAPQFRAEPPDTFMVEFDTSAGEMLIEVVTEWAPVGARRFYNLVRNGFFDGVAFYRVLPGFMAQFGVSPSPEVQAAWNPQTLPDDPVLQSNRRGSLTFATAGPNTRNTQLFINYGDNSRLDELGFAPIGRVVRGMGVADRFYSGYRETAPDGAGPNYGCMLRSGSAYLDRRFPRLDVIHRANIVQSGN